jgi:hypothetical protein
MVFGFLIGFRSTADVHIILKSSIQEAFRKKQYYVMGFLDLTKAYDTCWRRHIVKTLADNKIHGNNRTFRVVLGAESSGKTHTENGVA